MSTWQSPCQFEPVKRLAQGSFGQTILVRSVQNGDFYTVKEVNLQEIRRKSGQNQQLANDCMQIVHKEAEKMANLQHPNLIRAFGGFDFKILQDDVFHIVMEFCDGGSLEDAIAEHELFDEDIVRCWLGQITSALVFLHLNVEIAHCDLKTDNIFLFQQRNVVKLGHLGIAESLSQKSRNVVSFPENCRYCSPEWCDGTPYSLPNDIWAFGIVAFKIAALKFPFDGTHDMQVYAAMKFRPMPDLPPIYGAALGDFVEALLQPDLISRPTIGQVQEFAFLTNENSFQKQSNDRLVDELLEIVGENGDLAKFLLEKGVDVNAKSQHASGATALHVAAKFGRLKTVKILLEKGAEVDARDNSSETPLLVASRYGHDHVASFLIDNGADVDARSNFGVTPLFEAARTGRSDIVALLIKKGANVNLQTNYGETARMEASGNGHPEIVDLLDACL